MTLNETYILKPLFARLPNLHINTKPSLGSNFVDRKQKNNDLLEAEYEINRVLQTGSEINNLSTSKTHPPPF